MDTPAVLYAFRWLIYDTFRQAMASRVFWIMLGLSGICIIFCLGVSIEGGIVRDEGELFTPSGRLLDERNNEQGTMSLLFGLFPVSFGRSAEDEVGFLLSVFASWIAGTIGILMALVWTAGFIPEALHPSSASVLLAKPVPRWLFLTGKFLGVVAFVALHVTIFFVGTWLALGIRTGVWHMEYLLGIPLLVHHFAMIFVFTLIVAVLFRSTMACIVGGVLFWMICYAVNCARHFAVTYSELNPTGIPLPATAVFLSDAGYWLLPKPADWAILLEQALNLGSVKMTLATQEPFRTVLERGLFDPLWSLISSLGFGILCIWISASHLAKTDY